MKKNYFLLLTFFSLFVIQKSFAATSTITASGFTFSPASITIANGDSVNFSIASSHNVVEVSFATWSASGSTPLVGGFSLPYGGGLLTSSTGLTLGTHYYVCTPHAGMGMKGIIIVAAAGPSSYSFGSIGASVCENFTGYTASGFSPSPIAGQLNSNSWAITGLSDGILAFGGTRTTASSDYTRGITTWGASTTGGLYSITPNENFMVQGTGPDMTNGTITMRIQNATGSTLNNFDVVYDLFSKNDQFRSTSINFLYSMDNVTYYQVPSLKYSTIADSTGLVDSVNRSVTLTGFTVGTSAYLYLRWNIKDNGGAGSRDEVAIDNICVTPNTSGSASPALLGAVVINEFVNNNMASSVVNPGGMHSDYIELFNLTPSAIDLGGSSLGNSSTSWYNYTFPVGTTLPASGYLVVWCDTDTSSLGIHTNFTLSNLTGGVSMTNALGRLLDSVSYIGGIADTSFSRIPNGIGSFRNLSLLTPLAINDTFASVIIPYLSFRTISSSVSEAVSTVTVQVNISSPSSDTTRVDIVLDSSSTATFSDFSFTPLTLTFLPSSSDSQTFTVSILNDLVPESNETVKLNLSNATNRARFIDSLHTITIIDDDVLRVYWDTTTMTYDEAAGTLNADVMISAPSALTTSVDVTLIAGSATIGADFTFTPVTVTFPASSTTPQNVSFTIIDDALFEGIENFTLKISNPTNGALIDDSMFTVNIIDNDVLPTGDCSNLFFSEYIEGSSNNKSIEIYNPTSAAINLSGYTLVKYINGASVPSGTRALSGSIAAGDVFVISNNNANTAIILASDDTTGFMNFNGDDALSLNYLTDTIDIIGIIGVDPGTSWTVGAGSTMDHTLIRSAYTYQGNKNWTSAVNEWQSFSIDMTDSLGAHQIMPCGTPVPPIPPTISVTPILTNISEGSGSTTFNFTVVNPSGTAFSVDVLADASTSTASAGSDYTYTSTTVNFPVGGVQTVSILEDLLVEGIETITIRLRNPTAGAILIDSVLTINIRDNDSLLVYMQGAGSSVVENVALTTFNVKMNGISANPTSVDVHYLSGDATPGTDFTYRDTTITFLSGDTLRTLQINVIEDIIDELNEQVIISLSNATNGAKLGTKNYTLVIVDNDSTQIGIADLSAWMNAVKIYPNPVLNTLIIESNEAITSIEVYDLSGKLVHRLCDIQNATKVELDFSTYPNGTYIIKSSNGTENYSKSIIKQ